MTFSSSVALTWFRCFISCSVLVLIVQTTSDVLGHTRTSCDSEGTVVVGGFPRISAMYATQRELEGQKSQCQLAAPEAKSISHFALASSA